MERLNVPLTLTVLAILFLSFPARSPGQEMVLVRDPPTCEGCEITLEHLVTLGEREGPGRVTTPIAQARDSKGNYYVAHGDGAGAAEQVWVFGPDGRFKKTFGRRGDGPGEYRSIRRIDVLPGDSLAVYDGTLHRKTTLSPDLTVVATESSLQVGAFINSVLLPDGRMVVVEHLRTPERVGYPLQLVDRSGRIVRSFGSTDPEYRPGEPFRYRRIVTPGPDGGSVWSVGRGDYLMELWDTTGTRTAALVRDAEWFEPFLLDRPITSDGPSPQATVRLFKSDPEGRLWVLVSRPKRNWRVLVDENPNVDRSFYEYDQIFDWVIEVVDSHTGRLLVSQAFADRQFRGFLGKDMVVSYREDGEGYPFLDVWRISLVAHPKTARVERRDP